MSSTSWFLNHLYCWVVIYCVNKLNKTLQAPGWPFVSIWKLKSLTLFYSSSFVFIPCTTRCHLLSLIVICCHLFSFVVTRCHSLTFVATLCTTRCHSLCHSLSLVVIHCQSLSLVVIRCITCLSFYKRFTKSITKCDRYYEVWQEVIPKSGRYYKVWESSQKWDVTRE